VLKSGKIYDMVPTNVFYSEIDFRIVLACNLLSLLVKIVREKTACSSEERCLYTHSHNTSLICIDRENFAKQKPRNLVLPLPAYSLITSVGLWLINHRTKQVPARTFWRILRTSARSPPVQGAGSASIVQGKKKGRARRPSWT
jgi:hypothetical protein